MQGIQTAGSPYRLAITAETDRIEMARGGIDISSIKGSPAVRALITLLAGLPLGVVMLPGAACAEAHGITVVNHAADTIRSIQIAPAGSTSFGVNRLRSQLPPSAEARIGYSAGCPVDLRLGFDGGRVEDHRDLDSCANPHVVTGNVTTTKASPAPAKPVAAKHKANASVAQAAPVTITPWTGHSITKRFGGMD